MVIFQGLSIETHIREFVDARFITTKHFQASTVVRNTKIEIAI